MFVYDNWQHNIWVWRKKTWWSFLRVCIYPVWHITHLTVSLVCLWVIHFFYSILEHVILGFFNGSASWASLVWWSSWSIVNRGQNTGNKSVICKLKQKWIITYFVENSPTMHKIAMSIALFLLDSFNHGHTLPYCPNVSLVKMFMIIYLLGFLGWWYDI